MPYKKFDKEKKPECQSCCRWLETNEPALCIQCVTIIADGHWRPKKLSPEALDQIRVFKLKEKTNGN